MKDKTKQNIKNAGAWFVAEYAAKVLDKYDDLQDKNNREKYIEEIYVDSERDKDYDGSRVRLNALLRIIRDKELIEALNYIIESPKIVKEDPKTTVAANDSLIKILTSK